MNKEIAQRFTALCDRAANGNPEAADFIGRWLNYFGGIEQLVREKNRDPERFLAILAETNMVYSHPYFGRHAEKLRLPLNRALCDYADGLEIVGPQSGLMVVLDVATIEGGYSLRQDLVDPFRQVVLEIRKGYSGGGGFC